MAVRTLNVIVGTILLVLMALLILLVSAPVQACFGPKLFVGVGQSVQDEALFALVTLYVQEKTGVGSTRIKIETGQDPLALISGEKADLVFVSQVWFKYPQNMPILEKLKDSGIPFKTITNLYFELAQ